MTRIMVARFAGDCQACPDRIKAGDSIQYGGRGLVTHAACPAPTGEPKAPATRNGRRSYGSRYAYTSTGARMSERCGCEDYPCCGH